MTPSERTFLAAFRAWRKSLAEVRAVEDQHDDPCEGRGLVLCSAEHRHRIAEADMRNMIAYEAYWAAGQNLDDPIADRPAHLRAWRPWRKAWLKAWRNIGAAYEYAEFERDVFRRLSSKETP